jgi:hypothetical protein
VTARRGQAGDAPTWVVLVRSLSTYWSSRGGLLAILATRLPPGQARELRVPRRAAGPVAHRPGAEALPDIGLLDDAVVEVVVLARRVPHDVLVAARSGEPAVLERPLGPRGRRG